MWLPHRKMRRMLCRLTPLRDEHQLVRGVYRADDGMRPASCVIVQSRAAMESEPSRQSYEGNSRKRAAFNPKNADLSFSDIKLACLRIASTA